MDIFRYECPVFSKKTVIRKGSMYNNRAVRLFDNHVKVRIGIVANNQDDCESCDSCMVLVSQYVHARVMM